MTARPNRFLIVLLLLLCVCGFGTAETLSQQPADEEEEYLPLSAMLSLMSTQLTEETTVSAAVELGNGGDDSICDVTLTAQDGTVLWEPHDIGLEERYTWRGELTVTEEMLDAGEATIHCSYVLGKDTDGEETVSIALTAPVERIDPVVNCELTRSQSVTYAQPGQNVTLIYTVKNTGNVPVYNIEVNDRDFGKVGSAEVLAADEKATFTMQVKVETTALTSEPGMSCTSPYLEEPLTITVPASTIKIAEPGLEVSLESNATLVKPGDTVTLTCKLTDSGNVGYKKIQLSDQILGDLGYLDDIRPGETSSYVKSVKVQSRSTFKFTVTALDTTDSSVTVVSGPLTVDVVNTLNAPALTLTAQPDRTQVVAGEPVTFTLTLTNDSEEELTGITLSEREHGTIAEPASLPAGKSIVTTVSYDISEEEAFNFCADMCRADGSVCQVLADLVTIATGAPTPAPVVTPAPTPTPMPTLSPEEAEVYDAGLRRVLIFILACAVCTAIIAVALGLAAAAQHKKMRRKSAVPVSDEPQPGDTDMKVYVPKHSERRGDEDEKSE